MASIPQHSIKRALISVYDKTGIVDFARALVTEFGIEIISTGGTAALLKQEGIPVTLVEEVTGFPEMLDGRVKTLHPKIHAAILADRDNPEHMRQLAEQGIKPIDMVVVNLYPFEKTVADPNCTFEQAIEMIDIGGPCMLRAAAKNHKHVVPIIRPASLEYVISELRDNGDLIDTGRAVLASIVFEEIAEYDRTVEEYLTHHWTTLRCGTTATATPDVAAQRMERLQHLRLWRSAECGYGENPHQQAAFYASFNREAVLRPDSQSPPLSYNNYNDADAAMRLCVELAHSCGTGLQPVQFAPVRENVMPTDQLRSIDGETQTWRNLPHFQTPGRTYFVTFRLKEPGTLAPQERQIVFEACKFWDTKKFTLHSMVVMPDHVHLMFTPLETSPGVWESLGTILHSIKRYSAREINKFRGISGSLWLDEAFDRIMRDENECLETMDYIANNPVKHKLADWGEYPWYWDETRRASESHDCHESKTSRGQGEMHRLQTGATQVSGVLSDTMHAIATKTDGKQDPRTPENKVVCLFIKHTNACGVGMSANGLEAYQRAYLGDPNAAMGGILACGFPVTAAFAETVMETFARLGKNVGAGGFFVEVWIAPEFADAAVQVIRTSKPWGERVRLLAVGDMLQPPNASKLEFRSITGGMLVQTSDNIGLNEDQWKVVTKRHPSESEISDLKLAWLIAKHTKSNAISICKDGMLIGNGAGQMSRVMSCRIATWLANENGHSEKLRGSAAASDAFFPFADGPNILIDAGVTAIIQPGGSKRDEEVIAACDARGVAMIFTGTRHFRH